MLTRVRLRDGKTFFLWFKCKCFELRNVYKSSSFILPDGQGLRLFTSRYLLQRVADSSLCAVSVNKLRFWVVAVVGMASLEPTLLIGPQP